MNNDKPDFKDLAKAVLSSIRDMGDEAALSQLILYAASNWRDGYKAGGDNVQRIYRDAINNLNQ